MAITPEQACQILPDEFDFLAKTEKSIDTHLIHGYRAGETFREFVGTNIKPRVLDELQRRYERSGWEVVFEYTEHQESAYVNLTAADPAKYPHLAGGSFRVPATAFERITRDE